MIAIACLAGALLAGCGSDDDDGSAKVVEGPLPVGPDAVHAYTERFLFEHPRALVQPEHLVVVHLEPTEEADGDTCQSREGVDCIPYFVSEPTIVELTADPDAEMLARLRLVDSDGNAVVEDVPDAAPSSALVEPGDYTLELEHSFEGVDGAPAETIFLQPTEPVDDESAVAIAAAPTMPRVALTARTDCIRCDFTKAELFKQNFDGLKLIGSTFYFARFADTTFRGATMDNCTLTRLHPGPILAGPWSTEEVRNREFDADFSGAILTGATLSFFGGGCNFIEFIGRFRGATLTNTTWDPTVTFNDRGPEISCLTPDFRDAKMRGSKFKGIALKPSLMTNTPCTGRGADLTGAEFQDNFITTQVRGEPKIVPGAISSCDFSRDPESRQTTTLSAANLTKQVFVDTNLNEADLSLADLTNVSFQGRSNSLVRANLTGATIAGAQTFKGVNLNRAVIANLKPASFNGLDLTGTTLAGVNFAGIDLSQTDLSKAVLFVTEKQGMPATDVVVAPDFSGAKLSDGTAKGVTLNGQSFPPRYDRFKGVDLRFASLQHTALFQADLEGTQLQNAHLEAANLNFANLRGAFMQGALLGAEPGKEAVPASMRGAYMPDVDLTDADLRSVDLTGAHLYGDRGKSKLIRTRLDSANLSGAICSGALFTGSLNNTVFNRAQLVNTIFDGAILTNAKFDDAYLEGANFATARAVAGVSLSNAAISAAAGTWSFTEMDGTPFTQRYEASMLGPLASTATVRCPNGENGPCCPSGDLAACLTQKLKPVMNGPFPPQPECVPRGPRYDNCLAPKPQ